MYWLEENACSSYGENIIALYKRVATYFLRAVTILECVNKVTPDSFLKYFNLDWNNI